MPSAAAANAAGRQRMSQSLGFALTPSARSLAPSSACVFFCYCSIYIRITFMSAYFFACLPACLLAYSLACFPACSLACSLVACLFIRTLCVHTSLKSCRVICKKNPPVTLSLPPLASRTNTHEQERWRRRQTERIAQSVQPRFISGQDRQDRQQQNRRPDN